jgi:arylformamidase
MTDATLAAKGPRVFLDYDQAELDACYDQSRWATNTAQMQRRHAALSDLMRARLGAPQRYAYGPGRMEHLDVFRTKRANAPVFVFVHGGAWKANPSERFAYLAEPFVNAGAHVVLIDFDSVEDVAGNLLVVIDQVRRAIAWVYTNAPSFDGDRARIHVGGHSSGAHLTGCALVTDWSRYGVPATILAGAMVCSGMYELDPVALSARRTYVNFDAETIEQLSSQRHLERIAIPVVVAFGTEESPEFQRQGSAYTAALTAAGKNVQLIVAEGYNHFELPETLANPYGLLGRAVFEQMQLSALVSAS